MKHCCHLNSLLFMSRKGDVAKYLHENSLQQVLEAWDTSLTCSIWYDITFDQGCQHNGINKAG